jgi:hypothetical protein
MKDLNGIRIRKVPVWMRIRDILITLLAWLIVAHFMREALHLGYEYLWHFELVNAKAPNWRGMWDDLHRFVILTACLIVWLTFWALNSRKRLRSASMMAQPDALSLREHAETIGLTEAQLMHCKSYVTTTVFFDTQHQITEIRGQDTRAAIGGVGAH